MLQQRKEAAMKREKNLSQAFSPQVYYLLYCFTTLYFHLSKFLASSIHELIGATFAYLITYYQRYGGLVGAHQWAMKKSLKRDQNG